MSVIVAPIAPGFDMVTSLGGPRQAAERFLAALAPEGSSRKATLISATEKRCVRRGWRFIGIRGVALLCYTLGRVSTLSTLCLPTTSATPTPFHYSPVSHLLYPYQNFTKQAGQRRQQQW